MGTSYKHLTDQELMGLVQADDAEAFGALYDRLVSRAMLVAHTMHVNRDRVEDVVQEAFLSVWRCRAKYRTDRGRVHAWVLAIVRDSAIDNMRQHGRDDHVRAKSDGGIEAFPAPGDAKGDPAQRNDAQAPRSRLSELPLAQREVIALAYFGRLTHHEIARGLDVPLGTIKGRMRLGLDRLRGQLAA